MAAAADYKLSLLSMAYPVGASAVLEVKLTDMRTDAPVEGAVIFATRMDMAPDGMATMTSPVQVLPSTEPGLYRFSTDLVMAGNWRFSIAAKVQGELEQFRRTSWSRRSHECPGKADPDFCRRCCGRHGRLGCR